MFLKLRKFIAVAAICSLLAPSGLAVAEEIVASAAKPNEPTLLNQIGDGGNIGVGGLSSNGAVTLTASISENLLSGETDTLVLEAEVKKSETAFDFVSSFQSDSVVVTGSQPVTATVNLAGLTEGSYHWQVRVKNKNNPNLVSNWLSFGNNNDLPLPAQTDFRVDFPPSAPTGVMAKGVNTTGILVSWTNSKDKDLAGVQVWRSNSRDSNGSLVAIVKMPDISYGDSGLSAGALHFYRLRSVDSSGNVSSFSDQVAAVTDIVLDDQGSTGGKVTLSGSWTVGGNGSVSVAQQNTSASITYNPNMPATAVYEVFVSWMTQATGGVGAQANDAKYTVTASGQATVLTIDQTKLADQSTIGGANQASGFRSLGTFSFESGFGNSVKLESSTTGYVVADQSRFVYLKPAAPSNLVAKDVSGDNGGAIALGWNASTSATLAQYNIYRSKVSGSYDLSKPYATANGTSFTDTAASAGVTFFYVVRASDRVSESVNSNESSASALDNLAPLAPSISTIEVGGDFVVLTWSKVSDAAQYVIRYRDPATEAGFHQVVVSGDMTSTKITDLSNDVEHEFAIAALDNVGNQSGFNTVKAKPTGPLQPQPAVATTTKASTLAARRAAAQAAVAAQEEEKAKQAAEQAEQEGKIKAAEDSKEKRQRAAATVAILVVAVAAGIAGYYGYDWWLRRSTEVPKSKGKNGRW